MAHDFNLSFHEGDSFTIEHDNREFISPNVQVEKSCQNISYEGNIDLVEFYDQTFQKAYEEFIQKQIDAGHRKRVEGWQKTYYEFIVKQQQEQEKIKQQMRLEKKHFKEIHEQDKYQRVAKQIIVQVGNIDDFENLTPEQAEQLHNQMKDILKEYMDTFQAENPNFKIVNAVIHVDEMSMSPHLHLTYVPVAEMKRGQRIQNSLNSSLKAMGFTTDAKKDEHGVWLTAQMKWQTKERTRMIAIAKKHGLNIGYTKGNRTQSRSIDEYRKARQEERIAESTKKVEQLEQQADELKTRNQELASEHSELIKKSVQTEFDIARKQQDADEKLADTHQEIQDLQETIADAEHKINLLDDMRTNIKQTIDDAEVQFKKELVIKNSDPFAQYDRTTKGFGKNKETFILVPEEVFSEMDKSAYFNPETMRKKVSSLFSSLRDTFAKLPAIRKLQGRVYELEDSETQLKNSLATERKTHKVEIQQLKQENEQLRTENKNLKSAAETFKKVLHTIGKKFGITKEVNEELVKSQTEEKENTVPTRNNNSHDDPEH